MLFANYIQQSLENPLGKNQHEIHLQKREETRVILTGTGVLESDKRTPRQIILN